jgi:hypothetical protein
MVCLNRFQRGQWTPWNDFSVVNDPAETVSARSLTTLKFEYCRFSRRIRGHMRNVLTPWIGLIDEKNRGSKISCNCPFKRRSENCKCWLPHVKIKPSCLFKNDLVVFSCKVCFLDYSFGHWAEEAVLKILFLKPRWYCNISTLLKNEKKTHKVLNTWRCMLQTIVND